MRRLFMWHPRLKEVAARTRTRPGMHICEWCAEPTHYKQMRYDHIEPAVAVTGWVDFGTFATRLLDSVPDGIQHLCEMCHHLKTAQERVARKQSVAS